jgi:hypothetical protein
MKQKLLQTALTAIYLASPVTYGAILIGVSADLSATNTVCVEDMECWDCATMGNRICGTEYATGPHAYDHGAYVGGYN